MERKLDEKISSSLEHKFSSVDVFLKICWDKHFKLLLL